MVSIVAFDKSYLVEFERFRSQALLEGNSALAQSKLAPHSFDGQILLCYVENELVSISAIEPSHYTGDEDFAARVCRYHVLKKWRKHFLFCGFQMLRQHVEWADKKNFKVVYFTHDVNNVALNMLYQKKRKYGMGADNSWFGDPVFASFKLEENMLFSVSPKSSQLQFIYSRKSPDEQIWTPIKNVKIEDGIALGYLR